MFVSIISQHMYRERDGIRKRRFNSSQNFKHYPCQNTFVNTLVIAIIQILNSTITVIVNALFRNKQKLQIRFVVVRFRISSLPKSATSYLSTILFLGQFQTLSLSKYIWIRKITFDYKLLCKYKGNNALPKSKFR